MNKLNFKLVRVFQYFSLFNLELRYKFDKSNIVSNTFSRLLQTFIIITFLNQSEKVFDALYDNINN